LYRHDRLDDHKYRDEHFDYNDSNNYYLDILVGQFILDRKCVFRKWLQQPNTGNKRNLLVLHRHAAEQSVHQAKHFPVVGTNRSVYLDHNRGAFCNRGGIRKWHPSFFTNRN
jgi:hypothetical protein